MPASLDLEPLLTPNSRARLEEFYSASLDELTVEEKIAMHEIRFGKTKTTSAQGEVPPEDALVLYEYELLVREGYLDPIEG